MWSCSNVQYRAKCITTCPTVMQETIPKAAVICIWQLWVKTSNNQEALGTVESEIQARNCYRP